MRSHLYAGVGRPTKYTEDMPAKLIIAMYDGKSVVRFCREERINVDTFYEWVKRHSMFSEAFALGRNDCEGFWEEWLVNHMNDKNVNAGLVKLFMTNRFGWSDKKDIENRISFLEEEVRNTKKISVKCIPKKD